MKKIIIVGAGIGGLTAALALLRAGHAVDVFEKARAIGDVGAGITVGATASRGLYSLGLEQALTAVSDRPEGAMAALHYRTGAVLGGAFKDRQWKAENLGPTHLVHRAELFAVLRDAVLDLAPDAIHLGCDFEGFDQDGDGVTVRFANGRTARGDALIGCDGVRSAVRAQMFGKEEPAFTGQVAYRFLVPMDKARPYMLASPSGPYVGPGRSLTRYPIRNKSLVNCVAFVTTASWTGEGWSERCSVEELQALFEGWHSDVRGLAANAPPEGTAKWALYDRDPLASWVQGRVALLGDAAHPMLPFLGLGAAMAIEDAVILARAFGECAAPPAALSLYERARSERAGLMLLESRRQGQAFREGPGGETPRTLTTHRERMAYDPSTVTLPA
ncbi:MAG: FAD-dependent monooxygenase [Sphingobium sp.]